MSGIAVFYTSLGGLSGGGIHMPILMGFFFFTVKKAVPISNAAICFASASRFLWNAPLPHPNKNGKGVLVDHNLAMLMMPMAISGSSIGVIVNIIMPEAVVAIVFAVVVGYFSFSTGVVAYQVYMKEQDERDTFKDMIELPPAKNKPEVVGTSLPPQAAELKAVGLNRVPVMEKPEISWQVEYEGGDDEVDPADRSIELPPGGEEAEKLKRLEAIIETDSTNFRWASITIIWTLMIVLTVISLMRGKNDPSQSLLNLRLCDLIDWILFAVLQIICFLALGISVCIVLAEMKEKEAAGYVAVEGELELTPINVIVISVVSFFGSFAAAFAGIGPGSIFVPALQAIGVHPIVSGATGMYVTIFLTASSVIQVTILGNLEIEYAIYVVIFSLLGSFPGLFFQNYMREKTGRISPQVIVLNSVLVIILVSTLSIQIPQMLHKSQTITEGAPGLWDLTPYCPAN